MSHKLPNYLRTHRRRSRLTQDEVAYLLGYRSGAKVSRHERFSRKPTLETVFAYEVIFRTPARELFAGVSQDAERKVRRQATLLARKLGKLPPDRITVRKLGFLTSHSTQRPQ